MLKTLWNFSECPCGRVFARWAWHMCSALLWHVHEPVHVIYLKLDAPVASAPQLRSSGAPIADVAAAAAAVAAVAAPE